MTDNTEIVAFFIKEIQLGRMEFDDIRRELEAQNMEEASIRDIVKSVDNLLIADELGVPLKGKVLSNDNGVGILASLAGVLLFFLSRFEIVNFTGDQLLIFGLILGGLSLFSIKLIRKRTDKFKGRDKFK